MSVLSTAHAQIHRCYQVALSGAWNHPFFLIPLGHLDWREADPDGPVKTMAVFHTEDGKGTQLHINPDFAAQLPDAELFGVLCHEIMHPLLAHQSRRGGKRPEVWAQATDMAINAVLRSSGISLPSFGLFPPAQHADASAEELYELLMSGEIEPPAGFDPDQATAGCMPQDAPDSSSGEQPSPEQGDQPGPGAPGGDEPGPEGDQPSEGNGQSAEQFWGEMLAQAQAHARGTGSAQAIAKLLAPRQIKAKWDRVLKRCASQAQARGGRDVQTFARVNRRSADIILPGWQSQRPSCAVIVDTSGSVSDTMLESALTSVVAVGKSSGVRIFLALHDSRCYLAEWIKPETTVAALSGRCDHRGGTDPDPAFDAVRSAGRRFDALVYLTDGEVGEYPSRPNNVKRVIVGIVGESRWRSQVPAGWQELGVEVELRR